MPFSVEPVFLPNHGIELDTPAQFLLKQASPYSRNMEYSFGYLKGRGGMSAFDAAQLSGPILGIHQYWMNDGTYDMLFLTTKDFYKYNFGSTRYDFVTPQFSTGVIRVENGSAVVNGGINVDDCDDDGVAWVDGSGGDVTPARDAVTFKESTASVKLTVASGAGVENLAYHDISSTDLTAYDSIGFWFRSDVALDAADLTFEMGKGTGLATITESIDIPAISADTWTWVNLTLADPTDLGAILSIGIAQAVDKGAMILHIDQIVAGDWTASLAAGDYITIGTTYSTADTWYEILTVDSDTQITLTGNYAEATSYQNAFLARLIYTGTTTDMWDVVQFQDTIKGNVFVATNGIGTPQYYNGSGQFTDVTGLPTNFVTCKYVNVVANRLLLMYETFTSEFPTQVNWSSPGNFLEYSDLDFTFLDEPGVEWYIVGSEQAGEITYIFKERGAYAVTGVLSSEDLDFELRMSFLGCKSAFSTYVLKDDGYYYGGDNRFHKWNGIRDEDAFEGIIPYLANLEPNASQYVYVGEVWNKNQVRWILPYDTGVSATPMIVYDYKNDVVQIWEYNTTEAKKLRCIGEFLNVADLYVDDAAWGDLYVDEEDGFWDERKFLANSPWILYGTEDGYVFQADQTLKDNSLDYTRTFQTKKLDHEAPHVRKRNRGQQWWLEEQGTGSVTLKMKKDDSGSFDSKTHTIGMTDATREVMKTNVTWDKEYESALFQLEAQVHFSLLGFMSWISKKRQTLK